MNTRTKKTLMALAVFAAISASAIVAWRPALQRLATWVGPSSGRAAVTASPAQPGERRILYYEDPMHPQYRSDKPGIAPDCGMKLVPVYAEETGTAAPTVPGAVQISTARQQLIGVVSEPARFRTVEKTIRTVGRVALDEERLANVHVKVSGWIQKVFVDYTFQYVKKRDPLFTLYSPELLATEQEYLLALRADRELGTSSFSEVAAGGKTLLEAARRRLELWDLTDEQIRELEQTGKPQREITYYSPASGHVLERKAFPNQYVTPDTELYKLADHSVVWVYADVYEPELPLVELGQEATLSSNAIPGRKLTGRVTFIQPHLMGQTRTLPVRMEFPNPDLKLKPEMFVNVEMHRALGRQLTVPADAVLDSGERQRVFIDRGDGYFEPREVKIGERVENYVVIVSGLRAGEKVVTRANFLIDSESNLRQAVAGMAPGGHAGHGAPGASQPEKMPTGHEGHVMAKPEPSKSADPKQTESSRDEHRH
jgi:RND family efflux transporter MFP subunit